MAVLLDASAICAAADMADLNHRAALAWFRAVDEPLLVAALSLADADHLLQRELGLTAALALVRTIGAGGIRVVPPIEADFARAVELMEGAADARPRLVDALLVAAAERLHVRRVASFDRRPIALLWPRRLGPLVLEP